jgi:hypothetical protein
MAGRGRGESKASPRRIRAAEKQVRALELRKAGVYYDQIAKELGYKGHQGAYKAVMSALQRTLQEPADELRRMEIARLDSLFFEVYRSARQGSLPAIDRALKIMERRARLLGLDAPTLVNFDWRREAEDAGLSPGDLFEIMVQTMMKNMARKAGA